MIEYIGFKLIKDEFWNYFTDGVISVRCDSYDQSKQFLSACEDRDIRWTKDIQALDFMPYENVLIDAQVYYNFDGNYLYWTTYSDRFCKWIDV